MDKHERGWEIQPGRLDQPLPEWKGSYRGDRRRLPKVIQKLLHGRNLTAEEKAELLWRMYELEQLERVRHRTRLAVLVVIAMLGLFALMSAYPPPWLRQEILRIVGPAAG